jgi:alkylation response protein AidB-like acyl-CoA dehydrogenase
MRVTDAGLDEFGAEVVAFLEKNARPRQAAEFVWGQGDDDTSVFVEVDETTDRRQLTEARQFRALRFDAGLGWITGPPDFGGRGLSRKHEAFYRAIEAGFETPDMRFFGIGLGMVAPTILAHARDHIKADYLPRLFRGELIACQLFSEPGAGSDIASVATRAKRDGDGWVVTGQKVWTTGAQHADIGLILVRTNPAAPNHKALSAFLVDKRAPGVEVRPLRQMTGAASFNEVFFDEVRVPDEHRLGDVDDGWRIALTTLLNERASIGAGGEASTRLEFLEPDRLIALLRHFGLDDDPVVRDQFAKIYIAQQVTRWNGER